MSYSRTHASSSGPYSASTAVFLNELLKLLISLAVAFHQTPIPASSSSPHLPLSSSTSSDHLPALAGSLGRAKPGKEGSLVEEFRLNGVSLEGGIRQVKFWRARVGRLRAALISDDAWKLSIPAILYVLQNTLQYTAASNLNVATFSVLYQMKILTTAGFSALILKKKLSSKQWISLVVLALGVGVVQVQSLTSSSSASGSSRSSNTTQGGDAFKGFFAVLAACFTSGLAGVYFEFVLKGSKADLWIRNIQLSAFSLIPAGLPVIKLLLNGRGLFDGFTFWAWTTIWIQVLGGLLTAIVIKYSDNILKGFATSLSILLAFVASTVLFNNHVTFGFVLGSTLVVGISDASNPSDGSVSVSIPSDGSISGFSKQGYGFIDEAYESKLMAYDVPEQDVERREDRRSPAAVFGTKKMPTVELPSELENKLDVLFAEQSAKVFKQTYKLFLNSPKVNTPYNLLSEPPKTGKKARADIKPINKHLLKPKKGKTLDLATLPLKPMPSETTKELVLAFAAGQLPTEYAILRNVMREVQSRMGWNSKNADSSSAPSTSDQATTARHSKGEGGIQIIDFAAKHGSGAWSSIATFPSSLQNKNMYIQLEPSRTQADLSKHLLEPNTPGPVASWVNLYYRSWVSYLKSRPPGLTIRPTKSIGLCAFHLTGVRYVGDRRRILRQMWNSGVETIVLVEHATRDSFEVVQEARKFLLRLGEEEVKKAKDSSEMREVPSSTADSTELSTSSSVTEQLEWGPTGWEDKAEIQRRELRKREKKRLESRKREKIMIDGIEFEEDMDFGLQTEEKQKLEEELSKAAVKVEENNGALVKEEERVLGAHVIAPCSHDLTCPLLATPDTCYFGQNVSQPTFQRLTKNSKRAVVPTKYVYTVIRRGPRPVVEPETRGHGRHGPVDREESEKLRESQAGRAILGPDGVYETLQEGEGLSSSGEENKVNEEILRKEILEWGRVIKKPVHHKGYIEMDTCTPEGEIQRRVFSKSLGRQVFYDARHANEGDAFPHTPKTSVKRDRGISRLKPVHTVNKIIINNGKVQGLDKMTPIEYRDVEKLMRTLGVDIPAYPGRTSRKRDKRSIMGFNTEEPVDLESLLQEHDGWSPESQQALGHLEKAGEIDPDDEGRSAVPERKVRLKEAWSMDGEYLDGEEIVDGAHVEFKPTQLEGALEIDPATYADYLPRSDIRKPSPSNPFTSPSQSNLSRTAEPEDTPGYYDSETPPEQLPPSFARDSFKGDTAMDDTSDYSIAADSKVNLSGLGPGWMEDHTAEISAAAKRVAAKDRMTTFKALGIQVPDLGRPRTVEEDWAILEQWDGETSTAPNRSSGASNSQKSRRGTRSRSRRRT
ncbi:Predicted UDP-galactose transporter [Phaffia rhodozyma]|uniref:Predicted UDP-galactose transporter n=1 Tax=Phaffia rhodozyma TaxID=264483 RepID=A0A0F7SLV4_PHARH|nr:Predicted UDP-galactose transporter [Phaffia rhodozyma]